MPIGRIDADGQGDQHTDQVGGADHGEGLGQAFADHVGIERLRQAEQAEKHMTHGEGIRCEYPSKGSLRRRSGQARPCAGNGKTRHLPGFFSPFAATTPPLFGIASESLRLAIKKIQLNIIY